MKTRRILFFLFLPILADVFIVSCCDCPTPEYFNYSNCSLSGENLDNAGPDAKVAMGDTILKEAYGIQLTIERSEDICHLQGLPLFSSSAYAFKCDCEYTTYDYRDTATSIQIFTLNDFDQNHAANSDITDYFKTGGFVDVSVHLNEINQSLQHLDTAGLDLNIFLFTAPEKPGKHQFKVEIVFANGKVLDATTSSIYLK